jgi:hypothetical protein
MYVSICLLLGKFVRAISPGYKYKTPAIVSKLSLFDQLKQVPLLFGLGHPLGVGVE